MAGTKDGALRARDTNLAKDPNFYREIGMIGGRACVETKGFGSNPELAREAGRKGALKRIENLKKKEEYGD